MDNASYDALVASLVADALKKAGESVRATAIATGIPYTTLDRKLKGAPFNVGELHRIGSYLGRSAGSFIPNEDARHSAKSPAVAS